MKISLNWLKDYIELPLSADEIAETLTSLGLEVEGIETVESIVGGLKGFVVGEVLSCERFEVKEKQLSLTSVNIGTDAPSSIVCGAANVAAGQKVIVATVGTTLYKDGAPIFSISSKKTYGHLSEGMICAEDELGIGTGHDGIMVLPAEAVVGTPAADYFNIQKDTIIEIGLTPNRSDATNQVGVAKDLAASLRINRGVSSPIKMPDVSGFKTLNNSLPIQVRVENHEACPRYCGVSISGISVGASPEWLKNRLEAIGVNSINNIVDATNYVMHELGQPLHAFDVAEIKGRQIIVKTLAEGTKFTSLKKNELKENITLSLSTEDLMICDANGTPMCVGGVIGSPTSGVSTETKDIFLESAYFHPRWIRRSATRHNTRTDSSKIFEKGSDPNNTIYALKRAALLIQSIAGGEIASDLIDIYPTPIELARIELRYRDIDRLIGYDFSKEQVKEILTALEINIVEENQQTIVVTVPSNKADVLRDVDVIEEILRIYGFDNVPFPSHIRSSLVHQKGIDKHKTYNMIADWLAANGFQEMMNMSLSQSKYYQEIMPWADEELVFLNSSSNVQLDIMRPTMLFSSLEAVAHNQNRQQADLRLFEFGKTYHKSGDNYKEITHISMLLVGQQAGESWLNSDKANVTYYNLKAYVKAVLSKLGIAKYQESNLSDDQAFTFGMRYHQGKNILVEFGKINSKIAKKLGVKNDVLYADFQWDNIINALQNHQVVYKELTKFPTVRRDLALVIEKNINFTEIVQLARKTVKDLLKEINLFDVFVDAQKLGESKKSYAISFLFEDTNKTLQDKEIDSMMQQLIQAFEKQFDAQIRK